MKYLVDLNRRKIPTDIGNKADNLRLLSKMGMNIPKTYAISWDAYQRYLQDDAKLVEELSLELSQILDPDTFYAVRSSANIEDSVDRSFAGQFKSVLNVRGVDEVFQAIWSVWGTARSDQVISYLEKHGVVADDLAMGVIIQHMVEPVFAGVSLSRNPVTGADEVVVEAVKGSGEALVQSGVTPMRWINKWGNWILQPDENLIPMALLEQIVTETRLISKKLKSHVDLEWVYDGQQLYWLQVREITTLQERNVYSNHISKEMVPGLIKPLIGSINIPLVCTMWVHLLTELLGNTSVKPDDLAKSFYYRVYFNMGTLGQIFEEVGFPADSVETLMGLYPDNIQKPGMKPTLKTFLRLPRMLKFFFDKWRFSKQMLEALPQIEESFLDFDYNNAQNMGEKDLLQEIDCLYDAVQQAAYYNIVGPLLMAMYNQVLKGLLAKQGVEFSQFDLTSDITELEEYDPTVHLHHLHEQFLQLEPGIQDAIRGGSYAAFIAMPGIHHFQEQVDGFIKKFGYLSDNGNDFSATPWRETPDAMLDLIVNFKVSSEDTCTKTRFPDLELNGMARWRFSLFYQRAREFHLLRERVSAAYTFGYGLFRYYYLALGAHFVKRGLIDDPTDIYYLQDYKIRQLVQDEKQALDACSVISQHKADIERFRDISLPPVIYGDQPPPIEDQSLEKMVGVPTSIGHYTGKVTVVRGIRDFGKVQEGDVLVIPFSDVGWTPLFARARAVVAESGGMLSHSSIIAREYNIPAVVSVAGATRLPDDTIVTVNGHAGEVIIHGRAEAPEL
ncbi:MAG: PEP/pyruvate-binding domain-containing protein [Anaerolineales bacterium]